MISFIVPAFNEAPTIVATIKTIENAAAQHNLKGYEIILINDGSSDDSATIIKKLAVEDPKIKPIYHETNQGLGKSIIDGIQKAAMDRFIVVPGDNDISTESLNLMLHYRDSAELILTVPINKEARPVGRQIISAIYQITHNIFFGTSVGYLNGPGIWPTKHVRTLNLKSNRFSIISEMNVKLLSAGVEFAEVPIYLQADEPTRATVTWRNLREVVKIFLMLVVELNFKAEKRDKNPLNRIKIDFTKLPYKQD